jgi:autotransporter-associated beta strand protein
MNRSFLRIIAIAICIFVPAGNSQAANYYWDTSLNTAGLGTGGANDWTTSNIWNTNSGGGSGTHVTWADGNAGVFNGNGTVGVTLNSPISAAGAPAVALGSSPANGTSTTVNFSGASTLTITSGYFGVGWQTAGSANTATVVLNQSGGTIDATNSGIEIGRFGTNATYNLSGGTLNYSGIFRMANQTSGSVDPVAVLNITGGMFSGTTQALIGNATTGRIATATVTVSNTGTFSVGNLALAGPNGNATATINLNGGTIKANNITQGAGGTGTFNFNGGQLYARQNHATFMTGLTRANVRNGGAMINTDGFDITIGQALLHSNIGGDAATDGGLTKLGAGTLTLSAANAYTGGTNINGGTLTLSGGNNRLPTGTTVNFTGTSTLDLGSTSQTLANLTVNAGLTATISGASGTLQLGSNSVTLGNESQSGNTVIDMSGLGTLQFNGAANNFSIVSGLNSTAAGSSYTTTLHLPTTTDITASTFQMGGVGSANIASTSAVIVNLRETTTIDANNIKVGYGRNQGTLQFAAGLTDPMLTLRGAAGGTSRVTSLNIGEINSGGTLITRTSTLDTTAGTLDAMVDTLVVGYNTRVGSTTTPNSGQLFMGEGTLNALSITLGKDITGSGGTAQVISGTMTVTGGTVQVGALTLADRINNSMTATFNLNGGASLYAQTIQPGASTATRTFNWNDGTIHNYNASTDLTISSGLTTFALLGAGLHAFDIDVGRTGTVNQVVSNTGALTKLGDGTLILTAVNSYSGGTTVSDGVLQIGNGGVGSLSTGNTSIAAGATLRFNTTSYNVDVGGLKYGGSLSGAGDVVIDGPAATNLMRFNGDNSAFGGTFTVLAGSRTSLHAANSGSANAKFFVNGTLSGQAANGSTYHFGELSGTGNIGGGGATANVNWSIGALNTDSTFSGVLSSSGGGLTKVGTGTLILPNNHNYTGPTTVSGGTLQVDGSIVNSSEVNVAAGAWLAGSGLVPGISGAGLVSPGASPGILTAPLADPAGGLDFAFEFTAPGSPNYATPAASINDVLSLTESTPFTSALDADNTVSIYFDVAQISVGDTFRGGFFVDSETFDLLAVVADADLQFFVRGDGGGNVAFNDTNYYPIAELYPGLPFELSTALENNGQVLQLTATPEPASLVAWFSVGVAGMFVAAKALTRRKPS